MKKKVKGQINIQNKKAFFDYEIEARYTAGIQLMGSEIKSIRANKARITESFCEVKNNEIFIINMFIEEYVFAKNFSHSPKRERKLLLKRDEIKKIHKKVKEAGFTIVPLKIFLNDSGLAKIEIALAKGRKNYDKRENIKKRDLHREQGRDNKFKF